MRFWGSFCIVVVSIIIVSSTVLHCIGAVVARRIRVGGIVHSYTADDVFSLLRQGAVKQNQSCIRLPYVLANMYYKRGLFLQ